MTKHALTLISLVASLLLIGCATSDDRSAATSRAIVHAAAATVAVVAEAVAMGNCEEINSGTAREACLNKMRDPQGNRNVPLNPAPKSKFEDLETYKAKRDGELAKSE